MRKEFIIAVISGISLGLIFAFGIWRVNKAFKKDEFTSKITETPIQSENKTDEKIELTVIKPEEDDIVSQTPLKISGLTKPNTTLIISAEKNDYILQTSTDGSFEQEIDLIGGVNEIIFAYLDNENLTKTESLRIVYSTEFEKEAKD